MKCPSCGLDRQLVVTKVYIVSRWFADSKEWAIIRTFADENAAIDAIDRAPKSETYKITEQEVIQ